jgi:hypothetical protein
MRLPRDVSGASLAGLLCRKWQYAKVHQAGSHIVLETSLPAHQRIAIPNHQALRIGTLHSIVAAVSRHKGVSRDAVIEGLK